MSRAIHRVAACAIAAVLLLAVIGVTACGEDRPACYKGDYRACPCDGGPTGVEMCLPTQDAFGACVCGGVTPGLDAGGGG